MSLMQSGVQGVLATNEKLDDLQELGCTHSSDPGSPVPSLKYGPPDGGFQAWATAFGW
jgi:hypothetical protein